MCVHLHLCSRERKESFPYICILIWLPIQEFFSSIPHLKVLHMCLCMYCRYNVCINLNSMIPHFCALSFILFFSYFPNFGSTQIYHLQIFLLGCRFYSGKEVGKKLRTLRPEWMCCGRWSSKLKQWWSQWWWLKQRAVSPMLPRQHHQMVLPRVF